MDTGISINIEALMMLVHIVGLIGINRLSKWVTNKLKEEIKKGNKIRTEVVYFANFLSIAFQLYMMYKIVMIIFS